MDRTRPIGIMDSGVGGLTVAAQVQRLLPHEDILYFGDSANCPYGNKTKEELLSLAGSILSRFVAEGAKLTALACNTTSSLASELSANLPVPLIDIIDPAARLVAARGLKKVSLVATEFTASSGAYDRAVAKYAPDAVVISEGSPSLAALIDCGAVDKAAIDCEIRRAVSALRAREELSHIILGCTHYPIVLDRFTALFPDIEFIDPACEEAAAIRDRLAADGLANTEGRGKMTIFTSGEPEVYADMCRRLSIRVDSIVRVCKNGEVAK